MRRPPSRRTHGIGAVTAATLLASTIVATAGPVATAEATHGTPQSSGIYRIPYADGTEVTVTNDVHNHNDAVDLSGGQGSVVVAAASGWIRWIEDSHGQEPNPGDGVDAQDPPQPQDDALEHGCGNNDPANTVATSCADHNNYVWIEHPNGEWTKYTHLGTGTVSLPPPAGFGWEVDDWINAGQPLGLENDIGQATSSGTPGDRAFHLHFEVGVPFDPSDPMPFCELGGFMIGASCTGAPFGARAPVRICDIPGNDLVDGQTYTAAPCDHEPPTADAGGPYVVDEGSLVQLDGTGSNDPEGNPLTYEWFPPANVFFPNQAQPLYAGVDDGIFLLVLNVYDQIEQLAAQAFTGVTVNNVPPTVTATGDTIDEGRLASVRATFVDPGLLDTHTATVDWGDGTLLQPVSVAALAAGVDHEYGDNGTFQVTVTVTDDDGGVDADVVDVVVTNVAPELSLDDGDAVYFPGGDYVVVQAGGEVTWSADGRDDGSDDLTFTWSTGDASTYFNDGIGPDPFPSPFGTFPFFASDEVDAAYDAPGAGTVTITLADDDGGSDNAEAGVVVTGTATTTEGSGWWKHQFSGSGSPQLDAALLDGYLEVVAAVSSVFSEETPLLTGANAHAVLSPAPADVRARAKAELLAAWLHFAGGAVAWDAAVPLGGGATVGFIDLMFEAEATILDPNAGTAALGDVERRLARVRHAG